MDSDSEDPQAEAWNLAQIKQRPSRLNAKPIASVINRLMAQRGYAAVQATSELQNLWNEIVGPVLAARTRLGKVTRGILTVEVSDSGSVQELHFSRPRILAKLRERLPHSKIKDVRFRVG